MLSRVIVLKLVIMKCYITTITWFVGFTFTIYTSPFCLHFYVEYLVQKKTTCPRKFWHLAIFLKQSYQIYFQINEMYHILTQKNIIMLCYIYIHSVYSHIFVILKNNIWLWNFDFTEYLLTFWIGCTLCWFDNIVAMINFVLLK